MYTFAIQTLMNSDTAVNSHPTLKYRKHYRFLRAFSCVFSINDHFQMRQFLN